MVGHDHYEEVGMKEELVKKIDITYELKDVKFSSNTLPVEGFVSCEDGASACKGGPDYCKQVSYGGVIEELAGSSETRWGLAKAVIERDAKVRWGNRKVSELDVLGVSLRIGDEENKFYLDIDSHAVVEERVKDCGS